MDERNRQLVKVPNTSLLDVEAWLPLMAVLSMVADPPVLKSAPRRYPH